MALGNRPERNHTGVVCVTSDSVWFQVWRHTVERNHFPAQTGWSHTRHNRMVSHTCVYFANDYPSSISVNFGNHTHCRRTASHRRVFSNASTGWSCVWTVCRTCRTWSPSRPCESSYSMPCEVSVLCTQLITHVAFEWLFAGVRPHMSFPGHLKIHAGVKPCACSACDYTDVHRNGTWIVACKVDTCVRNHSVVMSVVESSNWPNMAE